MLKFGEIPNILPASLLPANILPTVGRSFTKYFPKPLIFTSPSAPTTPAAPAEPTAPAPPPTKYPQYISLLRLGPTVHILVETGRSCTLCPCDPTFLDALANTYLWDMDTTAENLLNLPTDKFTGLYAATEGFLARRDISEQVREALHLLNESIKSVAALEGEEKRLNNFEQMRYALWSLYSHLAQEERAAQEALAAAEAAEAAAAVAAEKEKASNA